MNVLRKLLTVLVGIELVMAVALCGWRLNSKLPAPPSVALYSDAITGRDLLALPDRFLFDGSLRWRTLGEAYLICGFFSKAETCLHQVTASDPHSAEVALARGYCLERLGMLDEARDVFQLAAQQGQDEVLALAWYRLGRIFLQLEQPAEARAAFEHAGQEHLPSLYERARMLVRSGLAVEAVPLLERLAASHPDDLRVWQLRARAADALGQTHTACHARDAVLRARITLKLNERPRLGLVDADFGLLHEVGLAYQLQKSGKNEAAAERMLHLADDENHLQNKNLLFLQDAAAVQLEAGNVRAARTLIERQIHRDGLPTALAWELYGLVEFREGHPQQAWQDWDHAQRLQPEAIDHDKLAAIAQQSGDPVAARNHQALARQYSGINAFRNNDLPLALSHLQKAATIGPELPHVWFYFGETERLLGNFAAAKEAYERCLKLNPCHGRAVQGLDRLTRP